MSYQYSSQSKIDSISVSDAMDEAYDRYKREQKEKLRQIRSRYPGYTPSVPIHSTPSRPPTTAEINEEIRRIDERLEAIRQEREKQAIDDKIRLIDERLAEIHLGREQKHDRDERRERQCEREPDSRRSSPPRESRRESRHSHSYHSHRSHPEDRHREERHEYRQTERRRSRERYDDRYGKNHSEPATGGSRAAAGDESRSHRSRRQNSPESMTVTSLEGSEADNYVGWVQLPDSIEEA